MSIPITDKVSMTDVLVEHCRELHATPLYLPAVPTKEATIEAPHVKTTHDLMREYCNLVTEQSLHLIDMTREPLIIRGDVLIADVYWTGVRFFEHLSDPFVSAGLASLLTLAILTPFVGRANR